MKAHRLFSSCLLNVNAVFCTSYAADLLKARSVFKKEAKGNSEMAYIIILSFDRQICFHI